MALWVSLRTAAHFAACTGGIMLAYVVYAMVQESLYLGAAAFGSAHTLTLLLVQVRPSPFIR
jgi:hypothetical protein